MVTLYTASDFVLGAGGGGDVCCVWPCCIPLYSVLGQLSLANASVLVVGAGGLGCPAAVYLSAAGLGRLGIVDYDLVELSNLHRQILHAESRIGVAKATSAARGCNQ